jgi:hypothetical protein
MSRDLSEGRMICNGPGRRSSLSLGASHDSWDGRKEGRKNGWKDGRRTKQKRAWVNFLQNTGHGIQIQKKFTRRGDVIAGGVGAAI